MEAVNHSPKTASGVELPVAVPVATARTVVDMAEAAATDNKTAIDFKRTVKCGYFNKEKKKRKK